MVDAFFPVEFFHKHDYYFTVNYDRTSMDEIHSTKISTVVETGVTTRIRTLANLRPCLENLDENLFRNGISQGEIIEIIGDSFVGKTTLLLELIARSVLPIQFGGKNANVVFFNLDHKFSLMHFMKILERLLLSYTKNIETEFLDGEMKHIVQESVNRLRIYSCFSVDDFELSLLHLDSLLFNDHTISLFGVDSISTFYHMEAEYYRQRRIENRKPTENVNKCWLTVSTHYDRIVNKLKKICIEYKICCAFTQHENYAKKHTKSLANYKFNLKKLEAIRSSVGEIIEFEMVITISNEIYNFIRYYINENGITIK